MSPQSTLPGGERTGRLADSLQALMELYGYHRVDTSIIHPADLFLTRAGDQIASRLFTFDRGGRQLALRPEFTAIAANRYVREYQASGAVVRWQFRGAIFEDDPEHARHLYQRYSIGAELIGLAGPYAEAEIIGMAVDGLVREGIDNWTLVVGHVGLMRQLLARFGLDSRTQRFLLNQLGALTNPSQGREFILDRLAKLMLITDEASSESAPDFDTAAEASTQRLLDVLLEATQSSSTMGGRTRHDIVRRLLLKRQRAAEHGQIMNALHFLERWAAVDAPPDDAFRLIRSLVPQDDAQAAAILDDWQQTLDLLQSAGVPRSQIRIRPNLSRTWEYYTGVVFELYAAESHVAGGGRYDELIQLVGGESDVPAVGFVYYPDQLLLAQQNPHLPPDTAVRLSVSGPQLAAAMRWAQVLRREGIAVIIDPGGSTDENAGVIEPNGDLRLGASAYPITEQARLFAYLKQQHDTD